MKNKLLLLAVAAFAMAGCHHDDSSCMPGQEEIKLRSTLVHLVSRSPDETLPDGATVIVTKASGNYNSLYANGTMSFQSAAGDAVGFDGAPVYYPLGTPQVYICSFNPAFFWRFSDNFASHEYNGSQDVMCAAETSVTAHDLYYDNYPTMVFKHVLTLLNISVQGTADAAASWGEITNISLVKTLADSVKTALRIDGLTGQCSPDPTSSNATLFFYAITNGSTYTNTPVEWGGQHIPIPTAYTPVAYTMCTPVMATSADSEYTILVQTSNVPDGVLIPLNLKQSASPTADYTGTTEGYAFSIKLNFVSEEIKAKATVVPWEVKGQAEIDI